MIALLFSRVGLVFMGLVAGIALLTGTLLYGVSIGEQRGRAAALERSVDILRERGQTDDEIRSLDDIALCERLGGLPDECAKLGM